VYLHRTQLLAYSRAARAAPDAPRPPGLPAGASLRPAGPTGRDRLASGAARLRGRMSQIAPARAPGATRRLPVGPAARERARRERMRELYLELEFSVEFPVEEELRR
jgi:hypothetical protein